MRKIKDVLQLVAGFQGKRRGSVGRGMSDERSAGEHTEITTMAGLGERICGGMDERSRGALRRDCHRVGADSAAAEMPQVDHRVGQGLERVVQFADALEAQQQATLEKPATSCTS